MLRTQLLLSAAAVSTGTLWALPLLADCEASGSAATCTGDLYDGRGVEYQRDDGYGVLSVTVRDLTRDIETPQNPNAALAEWHGNDGGAGQDGGTSENLRMSFDGGSHGVNGTAGGFAMGVTAQSVGGAGGNAPASGSSSARGGHGGDGGLAQTFFTSGYVTFAPPSGQPGGVAVGAISGGGQGGSSGDVQIVAGTASSGNGGDGGDGSAAETSFGSGTVTAGGTAPYGVGSTSQGGNGGSAGAARITLGDAEAGRGGNGGHGSRATTEVSAGSVTVTGGYARAAAARSAGGTGGTGGAASSGDKAVTGGSGGQGGAGGTAAASANAATLSADGSNAAALAAESAGGDGGQGGSAESFVALGSGGAGAEGGQGGAGGAGGSASVSTGTGTASAAGSRAAAVLAESVGGAGGTGGTGQAGGAKAIGGAGGAGGDGGSVSATLGSGMISVAGNAAAAVSVRSIGGQGGTGGWSTTVAGDVQGGHGGRGGAAGQVTVTSSGHATIAATGTGAQHGIRAEAIAGKGGNGGGGSTDAGKGTGGDGGQGGENGSAVSVTVDAGIATAGEHAQGILARNYGAAGGNGGSGTGVIGTGQGGAAGGGSPGGTVKLSFGGTISTGGDKANAILAQSIGGFSGDAGAASGFLAYGAGAQSAGDGAEVSVDLQAGTVLETSGSHASGIVAQSIGGGGGHGSDGAGISALGGSGSAGGHGWLAMVTTQSGRISTAGDGSRGILAQSIGGGGGDGGSATGIAAIGGSAGAGGNGLTVSVESGAAIATLGAHAEGVLAQSVGGGGGSAKDAVGGVAVGGSGGSGGSGGEVDVTAGADISTAGGQSDAVFAQSIGGGGGKGALAVSPDGLVSVAIGGSGGGGGDGGDVTYRDLDPAASYLLATKGDRARGIYAASVGGGGGDGGHATTVGNINVTIGGSGGSGGNGGTVTVDTGATVATGGDGAAAVMAKSVGGGGGSGGGSVSVAGGAVGIAVTLGGSGGEGGTGGDVSVAARGGLTTAGDSSDGIIAKSVGGGGGHAGQTLSITGPSGGSVNTTVGGSGGSGNHGGEVTVESEGAIATSGDSSRGILAQSVGGGGGSSALTGSLNIGASTGSIGTTVGGRGGAGGDGGNLSVTAGGTISTAGDNAEGIYAASVGGGGGDSGATFAGTLAPTSIQTTIGGSGGSSGSGGAVTVISDAAIGTAGEHGSGILAQSVANGGGSSGFVASGAIAGASVNTTVGGSGGSGGSGGDVTVINDGRISTAGSYAEAIAARSLGGGGGSAKGSISGDIAMGAVSVTLGGGGGAGGSGGAVEVVSGAALSTFGAHSHAILAQSHGGTGGTGGFSAEGSLTGGELSGNVSVTLGGAGGQGGSGGAVRAENAGLVATWDYGARGIMAQSLGGNGGIGGNVYTGNVNISSEGGANVNVAIGGSGGSGALGGTVDVGNSGTITTGGHDAAGIMAQSVGGNGGAGGNVYTGVATVSPGSSATVGVDLGGNGGTGMDAGDVTVSNSGNIATAKGGSDGIHAHSVGGGGGKAGNAANFNLNLTGANKGSTFTLTANVDVGGKGGAGGAGAAVTVSNGGWIDVSGEGSRGIVAQSVGGGGGDGGLASSYSLGMSGVCKLATLTAYSCSLPGSEDATTVQLSMNAVIGGSGGEGSHGGTVTAGNDGLISTHGKLGHAILAQSIGGGGGTGGEGDLGIAGWTTDKTAATIAGLVSTTTQIPSFRSFSLALGGSGANAADGGTVLIGNGGTLATEGDLAYGIFAQSVGGGGGAGGAGASGVFANVTIGSSGGGGGNGGAVTIAGTDPDSRPGAIYTSGTGSIGILAQSVGGGGGAAGDVHRGLSLGFADLHIGAGVGIRLDGAEGGDGGDVSVTSGDIVTTGSGAHGIFAQSVGGGGGGSGIENTSAGESVLFAGSNGERGDSGAVTVTAVGSIHVSGANAHGIFAQSASGSTEGDSSGDVTVTANGDVISSGARGRAILAQSAGSGTSGKVTINVAAGATVATSAEGAETVGIFHGRDNVIDNAGTIANGDGTAGGFAIRTDGRAALSVRNTGTIAGSVRSAMADGSAAAGVTIDNAAGAAFLMGSRMVLGEGGSFANSGFATPGSAGTVSRSNFTGSFSQASGGTLGIDVTARQADGTAARTDRLRIDGTADLAGKVKVNMDVGAAPAAGAQTTGAFLTATGGVADSGLSVESTVAASYSLNWTTADAVRLDYQLDFGSGAALSAARSGHAPLARHLQAMYEAGTLPREEANQLAAIADPDDYGDAIASFSNEIYSDNQFSSLQSSLRFGDAMMSCAGRSGAYRFIAEEQCGWVRFGGSRLTQRGGSGGMGFDETTGGVTAGMQAGFGGGWHLGAAFSYENRSLSKDGMMSSKGDVFQVGAVAKHQSGPVLAAASLALGHGSFDIERDTFGGGTARGTQDIWTLSGQLRGEYLLGRDNLFAKPRFDLGVDIIRTGSVGETGAGGFNHRIDGSTGTYFNVQPAVEFGGEWTDGDGTVFRPSLTLGVTQFLGGAAPGTSSLFEASPDGVPRIETGSQFDTLYGDAALGLEVISASGMVVSAAAYGSFSETTEQVGASFRLSIPF
ncbi:autotransporter outer membrane beta-barrel domain-containing protein [Mangrovicoccus sp. HB161399]|uniref:autotransporter outer membrane beta-barrel domain-containing protein n=1 Tax=Mangrovicoccus sp. HB161399 TaxID=2720392 RepID=UPI001556ABEF|nr:autotransporter outer membrane beta-barrel domain-containing protein [Mangrovicoccus sp. HB161399]